MLTSDRQRTVRLEARAGVAGAWQRVGEGGTKVAGVADAVQARLIVVGILLLGCTGSPNLRRYASSLAPDTTYVCGDCIYSNADGSIDRPYPTLAAALKARPKGGTFALAPGIYGESVNAPVSATFVGISSAEVVIQPPAGQVGIASRGRGNQLTLRGIQVRGATTWGVCAAGGSVALLDSEVTATTVSASHQFAGGAGVFVSACAGPGDACSDPSLAFADCDPNDVADVRLDVTRSVVGGNRRAGIQTVGVRVLRIEDPAAGVARPLAWQAANAEQPPDVAIPVFKPAARVEGNGTWGVLIVWPSWLQAAIAAGKLPAACTAALSGVLVADNHGAGVQVEAGDVQGEVRIDNSRLVGTTAIAANLRGSPSDADTGHGLVLTDQTSVTHAGLLQVRVGADTLLADNARTGLLAQMEHGSPLTVDIAADILGCGFGAVWSIGKNSDVRLGANARLLGNTRLGAAAAAGGLLTVSATTRIHSTQLGVIATVTAEPAQVGDGVGLFQGGRVVLLGGDFRDNARAHVVVDKPQNQGALIISAPVHVRGGQFAIAVNKAGKPSEFWSEQQLQSLLLADPTLPPTTAVTLDAALPVLKIEGAQCLQGCP